MFGTPNVKFLMYAILRFRGLSQSGVAGQVFVSSDLGGSFRHHMVGKCSMSESEWEGVQAGT